MINYEEKVTKILENVKDDNRNTFSLTNAEKIEMAKVYAILELSKTIKNKYF